MKKISSSPLCFTVSFSEAGKFGFSPEKQLMHNPESKKHFPEWRRAELRKKLKTRIRSWEYRTRDKNFLEAGKKGRLTQVECLDCLAYIIKKYIKYLSK